MSEATEMLYRPVFQMAYVTTDLDEAIRVFDVQQGVRQFFRRPGIQFPMLSGREMIIDLALAFVGPTMIELIAPRGGDDALYRRVLPETGFALRHHHVGFRLHSDAEWAEMRAAAKARSLEIILEVETPNTRALYLDTRDQLGHYVEYLHYFDEPRSSLPHIPQNRPASR